MSNSHNIWGLHLFLGDYYIEKQGLCYLDCQTSFIGTELVSQKCMLPGLDDRVWSRTFSATYDSTITHAEIYGITTLRHTYPSKPTATNATVTTCLRSTHPNNASFCQYSDTVLDQICQLWIEFHFRIPLSLCIVYVVFWKPWQLSDK